MTDSAVPEAAAIREELGILRASSIFARSANLFSLLRFVVEETLEGRGGTLKELVVGDALYGRQQPYDPRIDSTVRVEARRLRRKLAEHYQDDGAGRAVRIEIPTGGYRPVFRTVSKVELAAARSVLARPARNALVDLAILPFRALSSDSVDDRFADGLTDEVIYACGELRGLRVAPRIVIFQFKNRSYSLAEAADQIGAAMVLHGTVRTESDRSRVTIEIADPEGFVAWSDRIEGARCETIGEQERLANAIVDRIPPGIARCAARSGGVRMLAQA